MVEELYLHTVVDAFLGFAFYAGREHEVNFQQLYIISFQALLPGLRSGFLILFASSAMSLFQNASFQHR